MAKRIKDLLEVEGPEDPRQIVLDGTPDPPTSRGEKVVIFDAAFAKLP